MRRSGISEKALNACANIKLHGLHVSANNYSLLDDGQGVIVLAGIYLCLR